jgi:hypothetical protein
LQAVGEFAREKNVAKLGATIGIHGSEALRRRGGGIYPLAADIQKRGEKLMLEVEGQQP